LSTALKLLLLLLQLQGSYQVPASHMRGEPEEEAPMDVLRIRMPAVNLSPLQEAGYIHAKLAAHARRRAVAAGQPSPNSVDVVSSTAWSLEIEGLKHHLLPIEHDHRKAELLLTAVLSQAAGQKLLEGLAGLKLVNCGSVR
jgi:hypothetical protein